MKLLVIGDVVGEAGIDALHGLLRRIKRDTGADFVIVNGENAAGNGVLPRQADDIFAAGADVITLGNHVFGKQQIVPYLDSRSDVLRPANLAPQSPGRGWGIYDGPQGMRLLVMNLIGRCDMKFGPDNPFLCADRILKENEGMYDVALAESSPWAITSMAARRLSGARTRMCRPRMSASIPRAPVISRISA